MISCLFFEDECTYDDRGLVPAQCDSSIYQDCQNYCESINKTYEELACPIRSSECEGPDILGCSSGCVDY